MTVEPICVTIARMLQRPGATEGGGIERQAPSSHYRLKDDLPLHLRGHSPSGYPIGACGKHDVVPARSGHAFAFFVRGGRRVCLKCLCFWMGENLDDMEIEL